MQTSPNASGLGGHPKGLTTLFFTELWERFSYYGMRAILVLYMVAPVANGGLGFDPVLSWLWGFGAAGVGMTLGLIVYLVQRQRLAHVGQMMRKSKNAAQSETHPPLTTAEWKRVGAIFIFFLFTILFWAAYEQKGASLNLFADRLVRTEAFGYTFPSSWLQSTTAFFVILLAPLFSMLWIRMGERQPSSPAKFTLGLLFIGLGYVLMIPAAALTASGKISPLWLVSLYFLEVVGEMCLSPVGLSVVTKLAPVKILGIMMGVWFLAASLGSKLAGYLAGFFEANDTGVLITLYGGIAAGLLIAAGILAALTPAIRRLMGDVH